MVVEDIAAVGDKRQFATSMVKIGVEDVNDNNPVFSEKEYFGFVAENSAVGTKILTVLATDSDTNNTVTYRVAGKRSVEKLILIDASSGEIVVSNNIDRETFDWLNLTVEATDNGWPARTSFASVYIKV